ncbi:MAG: hypothetical protein WBV77_03180 [Solirubrobacteraceae bacterium]
MGTMRKMMIAAPLGAAPSNISIHLSSPTLTDWLATGASLLAAVATVSLVIFAWRQIKAMRQQTDIVSRQWHPLVYAHEGESPGADPDLESGDPFGCFYYLRNDGLGPALNIEHGVEVWGQVWPFGGQQTRQFRTIQPGASIPPVANGEEVPDDLIVKHIPEHSFYADDEVPEEVVYWCRYESLFGERWETRNSSDSTKPPEIRRLTHAAQ